MATTDYNLPTISDNMSADVVRDVNALAEAVDENLSTVDEKITSHLAQNVVGAHKAASISVVAPTGITATNTQEYLDALFTGYSSKLSDMVDALLLINPSLPLDENSTMNDVLDVIASGDVGNGKKWAAGTITTDSSNTQLIYADGSAGISVQTITVSGLDFIPSIALIMPVSTGNYRFTVLFNRQLTGTSNQKTRVLMGAYGTNATLQTTIYTIQLDGVNLFSNENGLKLPTGLAGNFHYIAIE